MRALLVFTALLTTAIAAPIATQAQSATSPALAKGVIAFEQDGKTYYATETGPEFIAGHYDYEGKGEPTADLNRDHKGGAFQRHQVPADPITWWGYECDPSGKLWEAHNPATGRTFHNVVVRYGGSASYPAPGSYDRMQVSYDAEKVYLMGEREKPKR